MEETTTTKLSLAAIRHIAARVRAYADRYESTAKSMENAGISALVDVANSKSLQMGIDRFFSHLKGVEEALDRAMLERPIHPPPAPARPAAVGAVLTASSVENMRTMSVADPDPAPGQEGPARLGALGSLHQLVS